MGDTGGVAQTAVTPIVEDNDDEVVGAAGSTGDNSKAKVQPPVSVPRGQYDGATRDSTPVEWLFGADAVEDAAYSLPHPLLQDCRLFFSCDCTHALKAVR